MNINYMKILSKKEVKQINKEMVKWVKKTLDSDNGCELYSILVKLHDLFERIK